jgi:hypothetical protein
MNKRYLLAIALASATITARAGNQILYDFEDNNEGWTTEWGAKQNPTNDTRFARHGKGSLKVNHRFKKKDDNVGVRILFESPKDFTTIPGFGGFSAWVYFPGGNSWEAQIYTHTGDDWKWCNGKLNQNLQPGWYQIFIKPEEIADAKQIRDIGIQVKNFKLDQDTAFYVDRIEAIYTNGK